jgi:hypothetical protein
MPQVEDRVDRLEQALQSFIMSVGIEFNKLYNSQMLTEAELRAFKEEMQAASSRSELDRKSLHEEMKAFKEEVRRENREMNRKWGELAKKMGTMVEDLVAPSLPRIVQEQFGLEVIDLMVRRKRKLEDGSVREFDGVAIADGYAFVNSTKSTLRSNDVEGLVGEIAEFRRFFPEYGKEKVIGILASLYVEASLVRYAETMGFLVLALGDELMEIKNTPGFRPKEW